MVAEVHVLAFNPIKSEKIYMMIIKQVRALLRNGELSPGDKLPPERELAKMLGVSRASVRQAFSALEAMGVVCTRQGEGTFVSEEAPANNLITSFSSLLLREQITPSEIIEARIILESSAAALCAQRHDQRTLEELKRTLEWNLSLVQEGREATEADRAFHLAIAEGTQNVAVARLMTDVLNMMNSNMWPVLKGHSLAHVGRPQKYYKQHVEILNAIEQRDADKASAKMREHLEDIERDFEKDLDE
jgi:GntR family transcriptional repressor for pyruvate dehydrogenase complex